jgi:hypothetical protein
VRDDGGFEDFDRESSDIKQQNQRLSYVFFSQNTPRRFSECTNKRKYHSVGCKEGEKEEEEVEVQTTHL